MDINLEAENSLLGCILKKGELIREVDLEEKHFYSNANKIIFKTMLALDKNSDPIDVSTIVVSVGNKNLNIIGGRSHLSDLMQSVPSLAAFNTYKKNVLNAWKIREAKKLQEIEIADITDIDKLVEQYKSLDMGSGEGDYNHTDTLADMYSSISNQEKGLSGFDTGFRDLNKFLDGFQRKDLIISAARLVLGRLPKC